MSASLSRKFLADLTQVYATLRPQALSAAFLSDLKQVHATLPLASGANLRLLAKRFDKWRSVTQDFIRTRFRKLDKDDPLRCPVSLFRPKGYGRLETAHTRTLAWLLDPNGEHGFGNTLLAALLRHLSGRDCSDKLRAKPVQSEVPINGSGAQGRLDVLAEGIWEDGESAGWVLAIEAKVDAWEGEDQLLKYEAWLRSRAAGRALFRVFLTPKGRPPETGSEGWEPMSFLNLVQVFRNVYGKLRLAPGFHFLKFYLAGVLQDVCRLLPYQDVRRLFRYAGDRSTDPYAVASYLKTVHDSRSEAGKP
jgi:hypothetical protein